MGGETERRDQGIDNVDSSENELSGTDEIIEAPPTAIRPVQVQNQENINNNTGGPGNQEINGGGLGGGGNNNGVPENGGDGLTNPEVGESGSDNEDDDDDDDDDVANSNEGNSSSTVRETSDSQAREEDPLLQAPEQPHKPRKGGKEWRAARKQKKAAERAEKAENKAEKKAAKATKKEAKTAEKENKAQEKRDRKNARKEAKRAKKQGQNAQNPSEGEGLDTVNMAVAGAMIEAGGGEREDDQPGVDPNRAFDTLKDLNALNVPEEAFKPEEGASDDEKKLLELKEKVYKLRKGGQLYRAVIHIKMMEEGKEPASEEKALQKKGAGKGPNRFSRFMNSSQVKGAGHLMDQAGQVAKITGGVTGVASYFDEAFKTSKTNSAIGIVTSVIGAVNAIRGLIKKVVTLVKNGKKLKTKQKIFTVIGIVTDLSNAVSKSAALVKSIEGFAGRGKGVLASVADKVSTISGMVGQIGGITAQLSSLRTLEKEIDAAIQIENDQAKEAEEAMARYGEEGDDITQDLSDDGNPLPNSEGNGPLPNNDVDDSDIEDNDIADDNGSANRIAAGNVEPIETEAGNAPATKKKAIRERFRERRLKIRERKEEKKEKKEEKKKKKEKEAGGKNTLQRKKFVKKAASFLKKEDVDDRDKETVALYLGFRKVRKKKVRTSRISISNLIATVLGLGASAFKTGSLFNPDDEKLKSLSGKAGLVSSAGLLGSSIANHFIKKRMGDKGNAGKQEETGMIKDRLYGMVKGVADDNKYGLRGAAAALEGAPADEKKDEVKNVLKRYEDIDKNLKGMGVNYGQLLQANNREAFKNSLIAGM